MALLSLIPVSRPMSIAGLALLLTVCYIVGLAVYRLRYHRLAAFPGPTLAAVTDLWFCKHWLDGGWARTIEQLREDHGRVIRISPDGLLFTTIEAARDIYNQCSPESDIQFLKSKYFYFRDEGPCNIAAETDPRVHKNMRKPLNRGFSPIAVANYDSTVIKHVDELVSQLRFDNETAKACDIKTWTARLFFDIVTELTFGRCFYTLKEKTNNHWLNLLLGSIRAFAIGVIARRQLPKVNTTLEKLAQGILARFSNAPNDRKLYLQACRDIVTERLYQHQKEDTDIFSYILDIGSEKRKVDDEEYIRFLQGQAATIISGGIVTSVIFVTSSFYYLSSHPVQLRRLQKEVREAFSRDEDISGESTKRLPYLQAVIDETLRIRPPLPVGLPRICPGAFIDGKWVPKGTEVQVPILATARNPQYFHDAQNFHPERWLPSDHPYFVSDFAGDQKEAFKPFSLGPRNCIGIHLASMEFRVLLSKLVWHFDWELGGEKEFFAGALSVGVLWDLPPVLIKFMPRQIGENGEKKQ